MSGILVIDDEPDILLLCRLNLGWDGTDVRGVMSGSEGLEAARSDVPDIVVLDLMMPGMDGFEVLRQLKGDTRTEDVPVVILTAKTASLDREHCASLGADSFITKPFVPHELSHVVDSLRRGAARKPA